jgi:hypothetical protein
MKARTKIRKILKIIIVRMKMKSLLRKMMEVKDNKILLKKKSLELVKI